MNTYIKNEFPELELELHFTYIYKLLKDIFQLAEYFAKTLKAELDLTFSFEKIFKFSRDMNN